MDGLLSQLRDIRGLDAISWWPPAPGWWGLAALLLIAFAVARFSCRQHHALAASRKAEMRALLARLREIKDAKEAAAALSEALRRLAIERHGREECAGLEGAAWLNWLTQHDPAQFDWRANGKILLEAPYMPAGAAIAGEIGPLIDAAERWTR